MYSTAPTPPADPSPGSARVHRPRRVVREVMTSARREQQAHLAKHHLRLRDIKGTLSTRNDVYPELTKRMQRNRKVNKYTVERQKEIRRTNEILVHKITATAVRPVQTSVQNLYPTTGHSQPHIHKTLNYHRRLKDRRRIAQENSVCLHTLSCLFDSMLN